MPQGNRNSNRSVRFRRKDFTIKVGDYVPKVVVTIGYVGYLMVATESIEGLIILGLVVLFLIILYVIAELWKKEPDDIEEDVNDPNRVM